MTQHNIPLSPAITVVALTASDYRGQSDALFDFRSSVLRSESSYPGMEQWIDEKVFPQLGTGRRLAFVGYSDDKPIITAVIKRQEHAKLCHLRIEDSLRGKHLGETVFALMASAVNGVARTVHLTLPEGLWEREHGFFQSFGFEMQGRAGVQYRPAEPELSCVVDYQELLRRVEMKLPRLYTDHCLLMAEQRPTLVMSLTSAYASAVMSGRKTIEVRRRFSERWLGAKVAIYATRPIGRVIGEVTITGINRATPDRLWAEWGVGIGAGKSEFDRYVGERPEVFAIEFSNPVVYPHGVSLASLRGVGGNCLRPPQSYAVVDKNKGWGAAVPLTRMMGEMIGPLSV